MKTEPLKQALGRYAFDTAFGGARRGAERSRVKERIFSVRSAEHGWNPKNQRPELWRLFNTRLRDEESMRVFPLSNWTEHDVWEYIAVEGIDVLPLYFAAVRPTVRRGGVWIEVDDERLLLKHDERPEMRRVRYPHSGMSSADGSDRVGGGNALPKSSPNCAPRAGRSDKAG